MAAPSHVVLGPLPAALHHRRDRCVRAVRPTGGARRLFAAAVLGLTLPLAAATTAVAAPAPGASAAADASADGPGAGTDEQADQSDQSDQAWPSPKAAPPQYGVPERSRPDLAEFRAHRHRSAAVLERPDRAVEQAPDQAPDQTPEQAPEQAPDQAVEQAPEQAPDQDVTADQPDPAADTPDAQAPADGQDTVTTASQPVAAAAATAILPARWQDPSTLQLPLGVGLGLIGCGLGLVGLRLRKG